MLMNDALYIIASLVSCRVVHCSHRLAGQNYLTNSVSLCCKTSPRKSLVANVQWLLQQMALLQLGNWVCIGEMYINRILILLI